MLDIDAEAVMRARGLLRACAEDDWQQWAAVLAADQATPDGAYRTFCAMAVLADRLADSVAQLASESQDDVLAKHADAIARLALDCDDTE